VVATCGTGIFIGKSGDGGAVRENHQPCLHLGATSQFRVVLDGLDALGITAGRRNEPDW